MDSYKIYKTAEKIKGVIPTFNYLIDVNEKFPDKFEIEIEEIHYIKHDKLKLQFTMFDDEGPIYCYSFKGTLNEAILQGLKAENFREKNRYYDDTINLVEYII